MAHAILRAQARLLFRRRSMRISGMETSPEDSLLARELMDVYRDFW
jgi:hypothetical protein